MNPVLTRLVLVPVAGLLLMGAAPPQLRVRVDTDKLTIKAKDAPLYGVLWAISAQADISLDIQGEMGNAGVLVTEDFKDAPLDRGLRQLLKKYLRPSSYTMVIDKRTGAVQAIQVFPGALTGPRSPGSDSDKADSAAAKPENAGGASSTILSDSDRQYLEAAREAAYAGATRALEAARSASTLESQLKTIRDLGAYQDPRVVEVLHPALASEAPEVRTAALEAMRWAVVMDPAALTTVRSLLANDPVPVVREAAFEVLIRYDKSLEARVLLEKLATERGGTFVARARYILDLREQAARAQSPPEPELVRDH